MELIYINWNPDPVIVQIGNFGLRYYGLLWVLGITLSYLIVKRQYNDRKIENNKFEPLFIYCLIGIIGGARIGHCLFYEPSYYLSHITEMILPIQFLPDGNWKFTGYQGLASHGGTLGLITALILYSRKYKVHIIDIFDMIAVATPICACCIRIANLMNSEIVGIQTSVPWAFIFERIDKIPRHPAQLYEAIAYLIFFIITAAIYFIKKDKVKKGLYFGLCLTEIFTFRILIELVKENQVGFEEGMKLNMGQILSIPFIIMGIYFIFIYKKEKH